MNRPESRWVEEPHQYAADPIALGAARVPADYRSPEGGIHVRFSTTGSVISIPPLPEPEDGQRRIQRSRKVLELYVALVMLFAEAGFPEGNQVRFSSYELLRTLGWAIEVPAIRSRRRSKPSGHHYHALEDAMWHLRHMQIERQGGYSGAPAAHWRHSFPVLQEVFLSSITTSREESKVIFSMAFAAGLRDAPRRVRFSHQLFRGFESPHCGALYRLLAYLHSNGETTIRLSELFDRLGLVPDKKVPSRHDKLLAAANAELLSQGVLARIPEVIGIGAGEYEVRYRMGSETRFDASEVLFVVRRAVAYGVSKGMAEKMAREDQRRLAAVLAAATVGIISPRSDLASMVVHYYQSGRDIATAGLRDAPDEQPWVATKSADEYLRWTADMRHKLLLWDWRGDQADIAVRELIRDLRMGAEPWLVQGLRAMFLDDMMHISSIAVFRAPGKQELVLRTETITGYPVTGSPQG